MMKSCHNAWLLKVAKNQTLFLLFSVGHAVADAACIHSPYPLTLVRFTGGQ